MRLYIDTDDSALTDASIGGGAFIDQAYVSGLATFSNADIDRITTTTGHRLGAEIARKDMLPFVGNYALTLPPTDNAKIPGAKLLTRQIRRAGSEAWRSVLEEPGQITIKNSIGAVDKHDGQPSSKPKRSAIMAAAPTEKKVVMTVAIAEQDPSRIMGMDVRLHFHDPRKSATEQGTEVLLNSLYGQSLQQARRRQQVSIARAA